MPEQERRIEPVIEQLEHDLPPEAIKGLELLNADPLEKVKFLMTAAGAKPAAEATFSSRASFGDSELIQLSNTLTELGLYHHEQRDDHPDVGITYYNVICASTKERLNEALDAFAVSGEIDRQLESGPAPDRISLDFYHRKFGAAMGIPQTAIDAFIEKRTLNRQEQYDITPPHLRAFEYFALSQDHYKEELLLVAAQANVVREISPSICKEAEVARRKIDVRYL